MPERKSFEKTFELPYAPEFVYGIVADVEKYPEFVPFCVGCQVIIDELPLPEEIRWLEEHPEGSLCFAQISVGFKLLKETYLSRIRLESGRSIEVTSTTARLFTVLWSRWDFRPLGEGCKVTFRIEFEFRSAVYAAIASQFFEYVSSKNIEAFLKRFAALHQAAEERSKENRVESNSNEKSNECIQMHSR